MKNFQTGISQLFLAIIISVVVVIGYGIYNWVSPKNNEVMKIDEPVLENTTMPAQGRTDSNADLIFSGTILAGSASPLLDFNKPDFDKAITSGKLVVLYFYANWCPICRAEFPKMEDAFDELLGDSVVGFRVSYNDSETDSIEKDLAREHGVAYQHTKIFIKNGQRIGKYPDSWDKARYLTEINAALK